MGESLLVIVIGFLAGMIPAMLLIGFFGGRQVEKQRKELQLKYEHQVSALRATLRRLMHRIDILTSERNQLQRTNSGLREAIRKQQQAANESGNELNQQQSELSNLKEEVDALTRQNLRYEGRLEEARIQQDRMAAQHKETIAQFMEAERLRRNLLYAASQLRKVQTSRSGRNEFAERVASDSSDWAESTPQNLDVSAVKVIEPIYVERLHESGIHTVADLAGQSPARIAHFTGLDDEEESKKWIAAAQALISAPPSASA
ncbi:MAG: hypothetical protein R3293_04770 [Candidatus Promineifilaceae bacterium]|nr:hypothetical protein [Candidatus Promineifilaceae bacterium]